MQYSRITIVVLMGVIVFGCLLLTGCSYSDATQQLPRSDIVTIDDMSVFGPLERPSVQFPHDLHTEALEKQGRDCSTCHLKESSGLLSQKFMRLNDADVKTVMDAYHENCIACHEEIATTGAEAGPVTCGECHQRQP
ncbi:MAG: cytochrome c3 family protein, partial [candidate division Zixibacteria bacterium]|nr:cytochrome c3 family protein [candidate division Zixibacteria bacterium]